VRFRTVMSGLMYINDRVRSRLAIPVLLVVAAASLMAAAPRVLVVNLDGVIHPVTVEILSSAFKKPSKKMPL
jgi:membrane-bound ClpP family serine protease